MRPETPCIDCGSYDTGPLARTPHGICELCACASCRGFRRYDDRGFLYTGTWPSLVFTDCSTCKGEGRRVTTLPVEAVP